ncbi:MAG TPA: transposase [Proteobacteria bacterium]|nr:transposase [Pseudomonadota bacterium]
MAKRKQYTQEFKDSAVKLVVEQGYTIAEAARNLGINPTQLRRWKNTEEENGKPDETGMTTIDLKAELARLKKESNYSPKKLKKFLTAFF